ncbi:MAG: tRNA pseudouridine(38-40) synthase TruA [Oscillospiraceae bacterium]|jgi:tRNA pseudouridine38-40 synthase|nr:tRNA pseudouridine(38-40) synthase TruA [Oscillospiraceae bacterium]
MGEQTYKLMIAYDGTRFRGWQRLPGGRSIQGRLEEVLSEIFGQSIEIHGSGRTDAGVHAAGQVASFRGPMYDRDKLLAQLRHRLPEDIGVLSLDYAPERFHARLSAVEKTYCYRIWNSPQPDVFGRLYRVQIPQALDQEKMRQAMALCLGTHDFLAFCSNKHFKKSSVRSLYRFDLEAEGQELRFLLTADGFLYNMVRILVGTVLEVGKGLREPESIVSLFSHCNREEAGETAPAKGLCLMEVCYEHSDIRQK